MTIASRTISGAHRQYGHTPRVWMDIMWDQMEYHDQNLADGEQKMIGEGGVFTNRAAFSQWFFENNVRGRQLWDPTGKKMVDCKEREYFMTEKVIIKQMPLVVPEGFTFTQMGRCKDPSGKWIVPVAAQAAAAPVVNEAAAATMPTPPPAPALTIVNRTWAPPQNAAPVDQFTAVRMAYLTGALKAEKSDVAARGQVTRRNANGTAETRNDGPGSAVEGIWNIGPFVPPPFGLPVAIGITAAHWAARESRPNYQTGGGRQAFATMLRGWEFQGNELVRSDGSPMQNQPEWSRNNGGLVQGAYTLATVDDRRNHDIATRARISDPLASPNMLTSWNVVVSTQRQIHELYTPFTQSPTRENTQRLLDHVAMAASTDYSQNNPALNEYYVNLQADILRQAREHNITVRRPDEAGYNRATDVTAYDLHNATSIPSFADTSANGFVTQGMHPLRPLTYAEQLQNNPGFDPATGRNIAFDEDNSIQGGTPQEREADYNRRFVTGHEAAYNATALNGYSNHRKDSITREIGRGDVVTPARGAEIQSVAAQGIAIVNASDATRGAFVQQAQQDPSFGLVVGEYLNDMLLYPAHYGKTPQQARAFAVSLVGDSVVRSQFEQRTDVPGENHNDEPGSRPRDGSRESGGRVRDPQMISNGMAQQAKQTGPGYVAAGGPLDRLLTEMPTQPVNPDVPEDIRGKYATALLHNFNTSPTQPVELGHAHTRAFEAIVNAYPQEQRAEKTAALHTVVKQVAAFAERESREGFGRTQNFEARRDVADLASSALNRDHRFVQVGPDGQPLATEVAAAQAAAARGQTLIATSNANVAAVAHAGDTDRNQAFLLAAREMLAHPDRANVSFEALSIQDRRLAMRFLAKTISENPQAFGDMFHELGTSQSGQGLLGRWFNPNQQVRLSRTLQNMVDLYENTQHGSPEERARAEQRLNRYLDAIDTNAGAVRNIATDRYIDPDNRRRMYVEWDGQGERPATERPTEGPYRGMTIVHKRFSRAEREMVDDRVAAESARQQRTYGTAVEGSNAIITAFHAIISNDGARDAMTTSVDRQLAAGNVQDAAAIVIAADRAAAGPQATGVVGVSAAPAGSIMQSEIAAALSPQANQAAINAGASLNNLNAAIGAAKNLGTAGSVRSVPAGDGVPLSDFIATGVSALRMIPGDKKPDPSTQGTELPGGGTTRPTPPPSTPSPGKPVVPAPTPVVPPVRPTGPRVP